MITRSGDVDRGSFELRQGFAENAEVVDVALARFRIEPARVLSDRGRSAGIDVSCRRGGGAGLTIESVWQICPRPSLDAVQVGGQTGCTVKGMDQVMPSAIVDATDVAIHANAIAGAIVDRISPTAWPWAGRRRPIR